MGHVYADLMGAACFRRQRTWVWLPKRSSTSQWVTAWRLRRSVTVIFSICGVAADGASTVPIVAEISGADGFIGARESVVGQLGGKEQVGRVVFSGNDEPWVSRSIR